MTEFNGIDRAVGIDVSTIRFSLADVVAAWAEIERKAREAGVWYETTPVSFRASGEPTPEVSDILFPSDAPSLGGQSTDMSPMLSKNHNKKGR